MNRPVKFRAWDTKINNWAHIDIDDGDNSQGPSAVLTYENPDKLELRSDGQHIWMQFTGLLDKNEKEIYEGDIVINHSTDDEDMRRMTVSWNESFTGWNLFNKAVYEVIGNIYENTELLQEKSGVSAALDRSS